MKYFLVWERYKALIWQMAFLCKGTELNSKYSNISETSTTILKSRQIIYRLQILNAGGKIPSCI